MRNDFWMERVNGIEPSSSAWEAEVMPLYDTRFEALLTSLTQAAAFGQHFFAYGKIALPSLLSLLKSERRDVSGRGAGQRFEIVTTFQA